MKYQILKNTVLVTYMPGPLLTVLTVVPKKSDSDRTCDVFACEKKSDFDRNKCSSIFTWEYMKKKVA